MASSTRACSGFHASSSASQNGISRKACAAVPRARALATPPSQEPQSRRRMSQSAVALEREALSCPWPRTAQASARSSGVRAGLLFSTMSALQQLWCGEGTLPADVEALAGIFTDADNPCLLEEPAQGVARLWRYQGFKL